MAVMAVVPIFKWKCTQDKFVDIISKSIFRERLGIFRNQNWFLEFKAKPICIYGRPFECGENYRTDICLFLTRDKAETSVDFYIDIVYESSWKIFELKYCEGLETLFIDTYRYNPCGNSLVVTVKFERPPDTQKDGSPVMESVCMVGDNPEETYVTFICGFNKLKVRKSVLDENAVGFINKFTREVKSNDKYIEIFDDEKSILDGFEIVSSDECNNGASGNKCIGDSDDENGILDGFEIISLDERNNGVSNKCENVSGDENLLSGSIVLDDNNSVVSLETKRVSDDVQNTIPNNPIEFVVQDLTYTTLWNIMNFIYTGSDFSFTNNAKDFDMIRNLIAADEKYEIQGMKEKLLKNLRELFTNNPFKVLEVLDWYDLEFAVELINSFDTMADFADLEHINNELYKQICRVWTLKTNLKTL